MNKDETLKSNSLPNPQKKQPEREHAETPFPKYAESAAILTLAIAGMYCIGFAYVDSYFHPLGIHHDSLSLPTDYYLRYGAIPVILVFLAVGFSLSRGSQRPHTIREAFAANRHWLIVILILCALMYGAGRPLRGLAMVYFPGLTAGVFILCFEKQTLAHLWWAGTLYRRLFIVFVLFLLMLILATVMGAFVARAVIEGKGYGGERKIRIEPKDETLRNLKDKEFVFIMYRDDLFYVIDSQNSTEEPTLLIVPKDQIKYATVYLRK